MNQNNGNPTAAYFFVWERARHRLRTAILPFACGLVAVCLAAVLSKGALGGWFVLSFCMTMPLGLGLIEIVRIFQERIIMTPADNPADDQRDDADVQQGEPPAVALHQWPSKLPGIVSLDSIGLCHLTVAEKMDLFKGVLRPIAPDHVTQTKPVHSRPAASTLH